jgi:alkanesulfonate monooxygenase SsuD/methylene tetrahydromethanopterin reductase-like flavin-dependent oxidoreductase (luciferase family)
MKIAYFTERPYRWIPEDEVLKNKAFFAVSNTHFDREKAADDYNYFLDEYCYAEELGFDAVALNEHHGNPFCMGSVMNVEASILARITKKVKIVLIGNPLPVIKHPLRMAEELAEIDLISRGRLITGWVRGAGSEQFFNNANPAYNREMFNEAHDFIIQAVALRGQTFPLPACQSVGVTVSKAVSTNVDSWRAQPRDGPLVCSTSLSVHRSGHSSRPDL